MSLARSSCLPDPLQPKAAKRSLQRYLSTREYLRFTHYCAKTVPDVAGLDEPAKDAHDEADETSGKDDHKVRACGRLKLPKS